jgi:hypothetical protein
MLAAFTANAAAPPQPFFNGFENATDVDGGDNFTGVLRVASGTDGVTSADGGWHATAAGGAFTRYGGYSSEFPAGGFTTSIDIYLDTDRSPSGEDLRFAWSSAINGPDGEHRRDFIFSFGTDGAGGWVMSASNNAPGWPADPGRNPLTVYETGWYTFQHDFHDVGGTLVVEMSVIDDAGTVLGTWTLSDPSDVIGSTVGGNRYGWLVNSAFPDLAIDNVVRTGVLPTPETKADCKKGGWENLYRADGSTFMNQGDCIQYVNTGK